MKNKVIGVCPNCGANVVERVADHSSNLAIATIELCSDRYDTHEYVINLKELHSHRFDEYYEEYTQKYSV